MTPFNPKLYEIIVSKKGLMITAEREDHSIMTDSSFFKHLNVPHKLTNEPVHEISNNVVCATSKASDQPAHTHSLIRALASRLSIL